MLSPKRFLPIFTIGTIPTSYLESLTYLEMVLCINQKLTEIIDYLDNFSEDNIQNMINEKAEELKNYIDSQDNLLYNNVKDYVDKNINNYVNEITNLVNERFNFLLEYIKNNDNLIRQEVEAKINELKDQINEIIIKGIEVYDPTTGLKTDAQTVISHLYGYLRYYGIKAINFDNLGLTASEFDDLGLTARQFDLYSKCKLEKDFLHNMYNPFTGEFESIQTVVNTLANLHKNGLTAQEFDDLDLTAQEFDDKNLTAYDFDINGKTLLSA